MGRVRGTATAWILALSLTSGAHTLRAQATPRTPDEVLRAANTITPAELERIVATLAADSMRGRDTPSPELLETARFVADRFRAAGLKPATESGYLQMYPVPTPRPGTAELPESPAADLFEAAALPPGWSVVLRTAGGARRPEAPNVVGILEGSDPKLRDEYVVLSAHMDHVGVGRPVNGDSIYNGADDNASGTATVVELAGAFASLDTRPRRSLVFMTVSGEEKGLLGSQWYVEHPLVPLDRTVADLNVDMIGRNWRDSVAAIGKAESTLGTLADRIAEAHPEIGMKVVDDPWPEESFYTRSDHYNFARRGVPILFFFSGVHPDYHLPGDEPEKLEYEKMSRIGRLIFYLALSVADADGRPRWDPAAYARVVEGGS